MSEYVTQHTVPDVTTLQDDLRTHHEDGPANHEHWAQVDETIAALAQDETGEDAIAGYEPEADDDRTLSEAEWHQKVQEGVEQWAQHVRETILTVDDEDTDTDLMEELGVEFEKLRPYIESRALELDGARVMANMLCELEKRFSPISAKMVGLLPPQLLRQLYDEVPKDGVGFAARVATWKDYEAQLRIVTAVYGDDRQGDQYVDDPAAQRVEQYYGDNEFMRRIALISDVPPANNPNSIAEYNRRLTGEATAILTSVGLPQALVDHYVELASLRLRAHYNTTLSRKDAIFAPPIKKEINKMVNLTRAYTPEQITRLHSELGMENLWAYNDLELGDMEDLLNNYSPTIEYYKGRDVTVEFIDARNDYNGAIIKEDDPYRKRGGGTLRFEVHEPSDIYRRMVFLRKLGIKPSVFVYSAHGSPGLTQSGGKTLTSYNSDDASAVPIPRTQFGRLVRDYMQRNRETDAGEDNMGRIQVIWNSCSGDVPDVDQGITHESSAEAIAKVIASADTSADVYAAPGVLVSPSKDDQGRVVFNILENATEEKPSTSFLQANKLVAERRGGTLGYPVKTYIRRTAVHNISVGRTL